MRLEVVYSTQALDDFVGILFYYSTFVSYKMAENIESGILSHVELLYQSPSIGHRDSFGKHSDYFVFISVNYKIVYYVEDDTLFIIRIFDARQNPHKLKE